MCWGPHWGCPPSIASRVAPRPPGSSGRSSRSDRPVSRPVHAPTRSQWLSPDGWPCPLRPPAGVSSSSIAGRSRRGLCLGPGVVDLHLVPVPDVTLWLAFGRALGIALHLSRDPSAHPAASFDPSIAPPCHPSLEAGAETAPIRQGLALQRAINAGPASRATTACVSCQPGSGSRARGSGPGSRRTSRRRRGRRAAPPVASRRIAVARVSAGPKRTTS